MNEIENKDIEYINKHIAFLSRKDLINAKNEFGNAIDLEKCNRWFDFSFLKDVFPEAKAYYILVKENNKKIKIRCIRNKEVHWERLHIKTIQKFNDSYKHLLTEESIKKLPKSSLLVEVNDEAINNLEEIITLNEII